jgi:GTP cyclohydrolase I
MIRQEEVILQTFPELTLAEATRLAEAIEMHSIALGLSWSTVWSALKGLTEGVDVHDACRKFYKLVDIDVRSDSVVNGNGKPWLDEPTLNKVVSITSQLQLALGKDNITDETLDTPRRFAEYMLEFHQTRSEEELDEIIGPEFVNPAEHGGMLVQTNIPFRGMCCHHWAPFFGTATIGYLPNERVVGLSKLARITDACGVRSPSTQESISDHIATILNRVLKPKGVIVVTSALHTCMCVRGVHAPNVFTNYAAIRGNFIHVPAARDEFYQLAKMHGGL